MLSFFKMVRHHFVPTIRGETPLHLAARANQTTSFAFCYVTAQPSMHKLKNNKLNCILPRA
jgi:hypothetical protein